MPQVIDYEPGTARANAWTAVFTPSAPMLAVLTIAFAWLGTMFGPLLLPLALVFGGSLAGRRRWWLIGVCLLLSPMSVGFVVGAVSYSAGRARIQGMGLPGVGYHNLDPELRCERATGGCLVNGGEFLTQTPNNVAIVALTRLFGPQPGAYTGPYPDEVQAKLAMASASPVSVVPLLVNDQVDLTEPPIKLDCGVGAGLLRELQLTVRGNKLDDFSRSTLDTAGPIRAAQYKGQCLILRVPNYSNDGAMIVLLDTVAGRPFAYYGEGNFPQRFPPVTWRK